MYKRTIWQDHVEGVQDGTDMNAANFNNIEAGTMEANVLAAMNSEYQRYCMDVAKDNEVFVVTVYDTHKGSENHNEVVFPADKVRNHKDYRITYRLYTDADDTHTGHVSIVSQSTTGFKYRFSGFDVGQGARVTFYISGGMI